MANMEQLCRQYSKMIGGTGEVKEGICFVTVPRRTLRVTVQGRKVRTPLVKAAIFSFDSPGNDGKAINEANLPLLQSEINKVISEGRRLGLKVGALHNHWVYVKPLLIGLHFQSVENPLTFAKKMQNILRLIRR